MIPPSRKEALTRQRLVDQLRCVRRAVDLGERTHARAFGLAEHDFIDRAEPVADVFLVAVRLAGVEGGGLVSVFFRVVADFLEARRQRRERGAPESRAVAIRPTPAGS